MYEATNGEDVSSSSARILHVVESFNSGVAASIASYVRSTPEFEHHLLARTRQGSAITTQETEPFISNRLLSGNPLEANHQIRSAVRELDPAIIHAHSSFAGAYARIAVLRSKRRRIVYTPHGYSFERQDITLTSRTVFRILEALLAFNTSVIAACSMREAEMSTRPLGGEVTHVPNVSTLPHHGYRETSAKRIAVLGRITAARSPEFFVSFANSLRQLGQNPEFLWIGGGSESETKKLRDAGILVTGWLEQPQALSTLEDCSLLIHPAAWDGFPMAVLEAHALGLPIVVRKIPALQTAPQAAETPLEMARTASKVLTDPLFAEWLFGQWAEYLQPNNETAQRAALLKSYLG